jgi:hypothetical protein
MTTISAKMTSPSTTYTALEVRVAVAPALT